MQTDTNVHLSGNQVRVEAKVNDNLAATKTVNLEVHGHNNSSHTLVLFVTGEDSVRKIANELHRAAREFLGDYTCDECGALAPNQDMTLMGDQLICPECNRQIEVTAE